MARSNRLWWAGASCGLAAFLTLLAFRGFHLWPAAGIALALTIRWGPRYWTALAAGHAVGLLAWALLMPAPRPWAPILVDGLLLSLAVGVGAWLGERLFRRHCPGLNWLRHPREVGWFVLAAILSGLPAALAGALALGSGFPTLSPWPSFLAHTACALAVTPVILLGDGGHGRTLSTLQRLEFLGVSALLAALGTLLFAPLSERLGHVHLESLLLLPLFWAAVRLPAAQACLLGLVALFVVWCGTLAGYGPFAAISDNQSYASALLFCSGLSMMVLLGAAMTRTRNQAVEDAQEVERRFRELLENVQMVAVMMDFRGRILSANQFLLRLTGWTAPEVEGQDWFERFVPFDPRERELFAGMVARGALVPHFESAIQTRAGERRKILWNSVVLRDAEGGVLGTASLGEDLTGRRAAQEQLRLQSAALAASANGVLISDVSGQIVWVNQAFRQLCGYSDQELIGQTPRLFQSGQHDREFYRGIWTAIVSGRIWKGDITNRHKSGSLFTVETTISPVADSSGLVTHFVAIQQDVTEKRDLEQRVRQAQNMESVGRLAGGIAHAFNNLLQVIVGSSEFLMQQLPVGERLRGEAVEIDRAAKQAAALTNQLLAFSRQQIMSPRPLQLNLLLRGTEAMLRRLISENIQIAYQLTEDLPWTQADAVQIEQLVMNLATYAAESMPGGGRLWISTNAVVLTADRLPAAESVQPGPFVCLAVRDTGPGLDQKQRARLFEPFYSPNTPGHLSGLGLAVVDGIVRQHAGFVDIESPPGQGTTFRIYLPAQTAAPAGAEAAAPPTPIPGGEGVGRTVLLVEDDDAVRKLALRVLSRSGYTVVSAASAAEARAHFVELGPKLAALFTDVVLTDGSGLDLIAEFTQQRPDLAVLVASGYTDDKARWSEVRQQGYRYMQKPYTADQLRQNLREILTKTPPI